jgi:CheY-like chemotaxis protein
MKTILTVDDDKAILDFVSTILSKNSDYIVLKAQNGVEAVDMLNSHLIDLLITDLQMPKMDGFQLLAYINQNRYTFPIIIMSALPDSMDKSQIKEFGFPRYLEKSKINPAILMREVEVLLSETAKGSMEGITLLNFLQLLQWEKKTCSVVVKSKERQGILYFSKGELINAMYNGIEGVQAGYQIIFWENAEIYIDNLDKNIKRKIDMSLSNFLLSATHLKDESGIQQTQFNKLSKSVGDSAVDVNQISNLNIMAKKQINMLSVKQFLELAIQIEGAIAVAMVDWKSGMTLGAIGGDSAFNLGTAIAGNIEVVRTKLKIMSNLGLKDKIENILITLSSQYHVIKLFESRTNLFFYMVLSKSKSNLDTVNSKLAEIESKIII